MRIPLFLFIFVSVLQQETPLQDVVKKCGSEVKWANKLDECYETAKEKKKIILWYVPRLKGKHMYNPSPLDLYMTSGPFTNPDIITLVNRKFIPVRMNSDGDLGIKATKYFEPALVFVDSEKKILHKIVSIRTINDDFFYNQMLLVLQQNLELNRPSADLENAIKTAESHKSFKNRLVLAKEYIADGDLKQAKEVLEDLIKDAKDEELALVYYELARVNRLLRNGEEAIKNIKLAKEKTKDKAVLGDLGVEKGLVLLKQDKLSEAKSCFELVQKENPEATRIYEAKYYLAVIAFYSQDEKTAKNIWGVIARDAQNCWAWKSAACLTRTPSSKDKRGSIGVASSIVHCFETVQWLNENHFKELKENTEWKRDEKDIDDIVSLGLKFLLRSQRSNGSWNDSRYAWMGPSVLPNVWVAVTAICGSALIDYRDKDPKAIDPAIKKATEYLLDEKNMTKRGGTTESCYSDGYRMLFFSKLLPTLKDDDAKGKIKEFIAKLVKELESQQKSGFWSHEYSNAFATGSIIHCLKLAQEAGIDQVKKLIANGAKALQKSRGKNGTYPYGTGKGDSVVGAASRMPACEMALFFADLCEIKSVETAIDTSLKNLKTLLGVRKSDYHAAAGANAGFFFFHNFYPATEAAKRVGNEEYIKKYKELLLTFQEIDGAFVDSHEIGRSYATALALLSLKNLVK